jgi:nucleotidyltransferase substrate binding protein (TIGR01987 family)
VVEKLDLKHNDAARALDALRDILVEPYSVIVRDAAIQRFEFTFEAVWKFVREFLKSREGIVCNSPKSCFRELFSVGSLSEEETLVLLEMTDDRNLTSHTYKEEVSQLIYNKLPLYSRALINLFSRLLPGRNQGSETSEGR